MQLSPKKTAIGQQMFLVIPRNVDSEKTHIGQYFCLYRNVFHYIEARRPTPLS